MPAEIKLQDRVNDYAVAEAMLDVFNDYFHLPESQDLRKALYYFIEITDLMLSLSMLENGKITRTMIEEAKRAGKGYLGFYLPDVLELKRKTA
jgi:hypothetical protein